jgi:flagellar biosynthesis protein FlhF
VSVVETNRALVQALEEHRNKEYIFIDTSGLGFRDLDHGRDLAELLSTRPDVQTHLVLPASLRATDMARMSAAYEMFQPSRLIFTRLDEASVAGPMFTEAARGGCPVSFFTDGQRVPEDLRAADAGEVANLLVASSEERIARELTAA